MMTLFQTNAWQSAWWETWGGEHGLELIRGWDGGRTGIYTSTYPIKGVLPVRSIEFVGSSYRKIRTTRTEYGTFSKVGDAPAVSINELQKLMDSRPWSEAIFNDMRAESDEVNELLALAREKQWLVRAVAADTAWRIGTKGAFDDYLAGLGRNTRLRLYNRRRLLESLGEIDLENFYQVNTDPSRFFSQLNHFHQRRWGKPVYGEKALVFNTTFLERVVSEGGEPELLTLKCDNRLISVLYNVKYRGRVYNLQSGFEEHFHSKLAVGTLHLGYAIEKAFREENVYCFDMLAGSGKNENYKQRLATERESLISLMLVKHPVLKLLYCLKDRNLKPRKLPA